MAKAAGTPSTEGTGLVCRVPSPGVTPDALGFSPRGTCVGSGHGHRGSFPAPFSRAPGISRTAHTGGPSRFRLVLGLTPLPRLIRLDQATAWLGLPRGVRCRACVAASLPRWRRNLNRLPFRPTRLRSALGPAYSRLTTHCRETLAPSAEGIPTPLRCYYRRDLHRRPVHGTSRPRFYPTAAPPYLHSSL